MLISSDMLHQNLSEYLSAKSGTRKVANEWLMIPRASHFQGLNKLQGNSIIPPSKIRKLIVSYEKIGM